MANLDFSTPIPAVVTITNTAVATEVFDGGTPYTDVVVARVGTGDLVLRPGEAFKPNPNDTTGATVIVQRKYMRAERTVQIYKNNAFIVLEAGQAVLLYVGEGFGSDGGGDQLAYYLSLNGVNDLEVTAATPATPPVTP